MIDNIIKKVNDAPNEMRNEIYKLKKKFNENVQKEFWKTWYKIENERNKLYNYPLPKGVSNTLEEMCKKDVGVMSSAPIYFYENESIARSIDSHKKGILVDHFRVCRQSKNKWKVCADYNSLLTNNPSWNQIQRNLRTWETSGKALEGYRKMVIDDATVLKNVLTFVEKHPNKVKEIVKC